MNRRNFLGSVTALAVVPTTLIAEPHYVAAPQHQPSSPALPQMDADYWMARLRAIYADADINELYRTRLFSNATPLI